LKFVEEEACRLEEIFKAIVEDYNETLSKV